MANNTCDFDGADVTTCKRYHYDKTRSVCNICGAPLKDSRWGNNCEGRCNTVSIIVNTSVSYAQTTIRTCEDADVIRTALKIESTRGRRVSLLKLLNSRLRKLEE